jgi:hypothetical protein
VLAEQSCPAVAAFWTSYGRALLLSMMMHLGADEIFYYDTDSLIVNGSGFETLRNTVGISQLAEPGKLRIVATADNAEFLGVRKYCFGGEWHHAGVMPDDDDCLPGSFSEQMWRGVRAGTAAKTKKGDKWDAYKHGIVTEDGIVIPFDLQLLS